MAGLLMETGALYVKEKLHRKKYFARLLEELEEVPESVIDLLRLSRGALEMFESTQKRLVRELLAAPELAERVSADDDSRRRRNDRSHLGLGGRRSPAFSLRLRCHELLRTDRRAEVLGGQAATRTDFQTAQPLASDHTDRGRQAGPALESATGGAACPRVGAWTSQPRHSGRGAQTRQRILQAVDKSGQAFQVRAPSERPTTKAA